MHLENIDWIIIGVFFAISLVIGIMVSKKAGSNTSEFFLSGRNMPWWLLGISMVATTFSADTPNLVTDIVRNNGVAGNWVWWAFLLTGMLTVFVYAKLWRRSKVMTDLEFYEMRYSGKSAAFLRAFRALYLGVFFNVMIMATVSLAAIKIGGVMLNLTPVQTLLIASVVTVVYSSLGGLRGVLITDFFQFIVAMAGTVWAAFVVLDLPQINGLDNLLAHDVVREKMNFLPDFSDTKTLIPLLVIPLAVQWWSVWYPGSEPGGGGYIAQRMLSAKSEKHAIGATLFFNVAHYALRPWPWILIAFASMIIFPDIASLQKAFPHIDASVVKDDLAYPAMLTFLPPGLIGLVLASLIAAFMSTISTHLNWGSSYVVHDFYHRFIKPEAKDKELVNVGRITTALLMVVAGIFALLMENALQAFNILLQIGAGTGLLFILRWFWWRINPWSEISAMVVSFAIAIFWQFIYPFMEADNPVPGYYQLAIGVAATTLVWLVVTMLTRPSDDKTLVEFCKKVHPGGPGWRAFKKRLPESQKTDVQTEWNLPMEILQMVVGCIAVYGALFSTGFWIYGNVAAAVPASAITILTGFLLFKLWKKMKVREDEIK